ncbi:hypothetical protein BC939DRAFT_506177 [Gamsiella multidivaricata]|uniref:uncharacterized protein n=1 Tax=Gamsiella multidivaricata TaxID=101098 RepID=UPI00221E516D|nr:uncharacterized protein BC939DRAFT_506177 [Gamsiella multidivaricata]KAI7818957.1 hypothetical protein BC939DRAFT_506177 [Gamsiella multidivaricata]
MKSSKSSLSSWFHRKKDKIEKALHHSHNNSHNNSHDNSPLPAKSLESTVDDLSIPQAPCNSNPDLVAQSVLSLNIFPKNTTRTVNLDLPKIGQRIEDITQLVHCAHLLRTLETPASPLSSSSTSLSSPSSDATESSLSQGDVDWLKSVESKSVERDRVCQLLIGIVSEFMSDPIKNVEAIRELVLVGPVLERGHFRSLLTSFVADLMTDPLLDVDKLQGLTQLVQDAPPGYIEADDLINIPDAISKRLQGTASKSEDFSFHLALAVSKVLGVMADQNVEGLDRVLQHDPLGKALSGLRSHENPFLRYVPGDLWVSGPTVGLKDIEAAVEETVDIVKAGVEDFNAMIENGQELAECLKDAFGSKQKGLWYISLRGAQELVRRGQLADLNTLVREAPSHQGYMFQWGICQLLGDIAVDPTWDVTTRGQAIKFLGELFATTSLGNVRQWILTILNHIATARVLNPSLDVAVEEAIKTQASATIQSLDKKSGEEAFPFPYLLGQRLPQPIVSALLKRVNKTADLEPKLLKAQSETCEGSFGIYIPLMSKVSLQDSAEKLDPLEDRVTSFLNDKKEIMLILGNSGAGKLTYNRQLERKLWDKYQPGGAIPLFIDLKAMGKLDESNIVKRTLTLYGFTDVEIQELKEHRRVILICDGYDECRQWVHLHSRIKDERWKSFQIVVTCRTQYLTPTYRNYFVPRPAANQSASEASSLFEEAVIVPFKSDQIENFIGQFRDTREAKDIFDDRPIWSTDTYMKCLSNLTALVKNPFMLKLVLVTLLSVVGSNNDLSRTTTTRFNPYSAFIKQHLEREVRRLGDLRMRMSNIEEEALGAIESDFVFYSIHFSMRLAHAVFIEQGGVNAIEYSAADGRGWKARFFVIPPRRSSPSSGGSVGPKKTIFSFPHRSILEFFYSCRLCDFVQDLRDLDPSSDEAQYSDLSICLDPTSDISLLAAHPLNKRNIVSESSIVHFLVEHANANSQFKDQLHTIINLSKTQPSVSQASANAMTILVQAGVKLNGSDLRGIKIPGADLSGEATLISLSFKM